MNWSWAIDGISDSTPRTRGPECANFITKRRRILEGIIVTGLCLWALKWAIHRLKPISNSCSYYQRLKQQEHTTPLGKKILLIAMTFVFGMEIGFKFATKTVIFVLNPCHITTMMQIYLLAAKPSKVTTAVFRIQMNYLNGPFLAFMFSETDSRLLNMERSIYWIQHGLIFIISIYLLRLGGAYTMEHITDPEWNVIGYALMMIYHFSFLQYLSALSSINLSHMLCAALSDPFSGPNYRIAACIHQAFLSPILCKLFTLIFSNPNQIELDVKIITNSVNGSDNEQIYSDYKGNHHSTATTTTSTIIPSLSISTIIKDPIMTTKID